MTFACGQSNGTVRLWNAHTGKLRRTLTGHKGRIESLAFSPDGKMLATGGGGGDASIKLWDLSSFRD